LIRVFTNHVGKENWYYKLLMLILFKLMHWLLNNQLLLFVWGYSGSCG